MTLLVLILSIVGLLGYMSGRFPHAALILSVVGIYFATGYMAVAAIACIGAFLYRDGPWL